MDQATITKLIAVSHHAHSDASEMAGLIVLPLLLCAAIAGFLVARWIFRGGLSCSGTRGNRSLQNSNLFQR